MDSLSQLAGGFAELLTPELLLVAFIGVLLGTVIGVLPGVGPVAGISLLIPFTFDLGGVGTLVMLAGIYYGAQYGGSTTSILVNVPGESSSVITAIDGHAMARQGRAGPALAVAAIGSFIAGTFGVVALMFLAPRLVPIALSFGPRENFALMVLGLSMASLLAGGSIRKSLISLFAGLLIAMIGLDPITAVPRFTGGSPNLASGIHVVALVVGLFGVSEILSSAEALAFTTGVRAKVGRLWLSRDDWKRSRGAIARGSVLGFLIGLLPGGGGIVSSLVSYATEKLASKHKEEFGHGAIEGVAGPESANNAASTGAFVPLLTLGLPVNPVVAVILNALLIQGLQPGPRFLVENPDLFWTFVASMYLGNAMLLVLNLPLVGLWASVLKIPQRILLALVALLAIIGVFSVDRSVFDLFVMLVAGVVGYLLRKSGFSMAPLVLAFVLAPRLEQSFRQALLISQGDLSTFVTDPLPLVMLALSAVMILYGFAFPIWRRHRGRSSVEGLVPLGEDE